MKNQNFENDFDDNLDLDDDFIFFLDDDDEEFLSNVKEFSAPDEELSSPAIEVSAPKEELPSSEEFSASEDELPSPDEEFSASEEELSALMDEFSSTEENISADMDSEIESEVDDLLIDIFGEPFSWKKELASWVLMFVCAFIIAFIVDHFIIINATVPTGSMQNTIMAKDRMIGWQLAYLFNEPERGDVIIFEYPDDPSQKYVKRIIGLPTETVTITDGQIFINDSENPLVEDYLPEEWVWKNDGFTFVVPEDCYFVLGDNRNNSHDARFWTNTYVTKDAIMGKAIFCYWPLSNIKLIK